MDIRLCDNGDLDKAPNIIVELEIQTFHGPHKKMLKHDWIKTLNRRIGYMHLHNNHGKLNNINNDEHNGFDNGTIDFKKTIKLVQKNCPKAILTVESHLSDTERSIELKKSIQNNR